MLKATSGTSSKTSESSFYSSFVNAIDGSPASAYPVARSATLFRSLQTRRIRFTRRCCDADDSSTMLGDQSAALFGGYENGGMFSPKVTIRRVDLNTIKPSSNSLLCCVCIQLDVSPVARSLQSSFLEGWADLRVQWIA